MAFRILIVDDDTTFREELRDCLEQRYRVVEAESGEQALKLLNGSQAIDLVVMDVMLPGLRGTATLERIKKMRPELPIIIFTGFGSKEVAIEALKAHADDYLEKPGSVAAIMETVDRLLREKAVGGIEEAGSLEDKIVRAKAFINNNLDRRTTLQEVAREVFLSPKYLSRLFKQKTGVGINRYSQQVRVDKAKSLLLRGNLTVNQIAEQLGYKNTESFIRTFTKNTGCSPGRFRKKAGGRPGTRVSTPAPQRNKGESRHRAPDNAKKVRR